MLTKLTIDNYALIEKSIVDFHEGFTVITGETGAGKSIMLDALALLLGVRADSKAMGCKDRKTVVEASFSNPNPSIKAICEENGIDWDAEEIILRREISPSGKSRGFVNDSPVNLAVLTSVSSYLIDLHSQHSNSLLNKPHEQLALIDAFGRNAALLNEYKDTFKKYVALRNGIKKIKEAVSKGKENREFILFRLEQLDKLKPKKGELALLERESEILGDADRFKEDLSEVNSLLDNGNNSALKQLQGVMSLLESLDMDLLDPKGDDNLLERLDTVRIELRDIADTVEGYAEKIMADPLRLEKVRRRIEAYYDAMKRFKVKDEEELISLYLQLKEELAAIDGDDTDISRQEAELKELAKLLKSRADSLSEAREKAAADFAATITGKIAPLGLPNVRFEVRIEKGKLSQEGQDNVVFYCSFNKNHPLQPVSGIASGGEIARVMLGIKSIMAEHVDLPTLIFDEIDTGVSGEIAHKMGTMMKEMSRNIQVLAVTHLPQVASNGATHLKVYKADDSEKTVSRIKVLSTEERVMEIAGMLSGNTINDVALQNARLLLQID